MPPLQLNKMVFRSKLGPTTIACLGALLPGCVDVHESADLKVRNSTATSSIWPISLASQKPRTEALSTSSMALTLIFSRPNSFL